MEFKVGDKVIQTKSCSGTKAGNEYIVSTAYNDRDTLCIYVNPNHEEDGYCSDQEFWKPVKKTPKREFKVGDKVRVLDCAYQNLEHIGVESEIINMTEEGYVIRVNGCLATKVELIESPERREVKEKEEGVSHPIIGKGTNIAVSYYSDYFKVYRPMWTFNKDLDEKWEKEYTCDWNIPSPKKVMASLKTIASKLLDADIKALIKAGWLDEELDLTPAGQQAVLAHVLLANKVELAKEARKVIKDRKDEEEE